ncbi:peptidylprolyl isomerase [Acinetobacter tianfuensis]|uniref:Peptidyl-prolyl cis-trans isomerase n=1 Tax=Acinetobacter tianfuensis TaxID=2419603 RepID=A0A3A8E5C6_9GAMM|nr:peptidylprolyl isomerase [Acinetobacter tianfuensis]RKG30272.1 peptidyl-prolyl cis-trans isomerase [Acinetobacter tianfuensis]
MLKQVLAVIAASAVSIGAWAQNTIVEMKTNMGSIEIELLDDKAPVSVKNFIQYANEGLYNGTIFHRVIPGFMIQGGGMDAKMAEKQTRAPIINESSNGIKNSRGTLAMARKNHPDSASSQFFINTEDNDFLNKSAMNAGYAVFGKVTKGMDVVDKIEKVQTAIYLPHQDVPVKPVVINAVTVKPPSVKK